MSFVALLFQISGHQCNVVSIHKTITILRLKYYYVYVYAYWLSNVQVIYEYAFRSFSTV